MKKNIKKAFKFPVVLLQYKIVFRIIDNIIIKNRTKLE